MPCTRGINCFLSTNHGKDIITEYPHPDGMSMQLVDGQSPWRYRPSPKKPSASSDAPSSPFSVRGTKTNPTVSVYVPSVPGSPFSIHYQIDQIPTSPCKFVFFKVYINSRQIVAWGVDTASATKGSISVSLWQPGPLYDGTIGVEKRSLVFLPDQDKKGIAEDGGLIEIQTFRASARQSRSPVLEKFRHHDNYGVATPSTGLVSSTESLDFHTYALIDPKDLPFATFKLYYRSEASLRQLAIIPGPSLSPDHKLLTPSTLNLLNNNSPTLPATPSTPTPPSLVNNNSPTLPTDDDDDDVFAPRWRDSIESYISRPLPALPGKKNHALRRDKRNISDISPNTSKPPERRRDSGFSQRPFSTASETPSLTPSVRNLLQTGELDPEKAEFGATTITPAAAPSWVDVMEPPPKVWSSSPGGSFSAGDWERARVSLGLPPGCMRGLGVVESGGDGGGDEKEGAVSVKTQEGGLSVKEEDTPAKKEEALPAKKQALPLAPQTPIGPKKRRGSFWSRKERMEAATKKSGGAKKRRGSFWGRRESLDSEKRVEVEPLVKKTLEPATPRNSYEKEGCGEKQSAEVTGAMSPVKRCIGGFVERICSPAKGGGGLLSGFRRKVKGGGC